MCEARVAGAKRQKSDYGVLPPIFLAHFSSKTAFKCVSIIILCWPIVTFYNTYKYNIKLTYLSSF